MFIVTVLLLWWRHIKTGKVSNNMGRHVYRTGAGKTVITDDGVDLGITLYQARHPDFMSTSPGWWRSFWNRIDTILMIGASGVLSLGVLQAVAADSTMTVIFLFACVCLIVAYLLGSAAYRCWPVRKNMFGTTDRDERDSIRELLSVDGGMTDELVTLMVRAGMTGDKSDPVHQLFATKLDTAVTIARNTKTLAGGSADPTVEALELARLENREAHCAADPGKYMASLDE